VAGASQPTLLSFSAQEVIRRQETSEDADQGNAASLLAQTRVVASRRRTVWRGNSFVADFDKIYQLRRKAAIEPIPERPARVSLRPVAIQMAGFKR